MSKGFLTKYLPAHLFPPPKYFLIGSKFELFTPFNIMVVIRNSFLNNFIYQILKPKNPKLQRSKNTRFHNSCVFQADL